MSKKEHGRKWDGKSRIPDDTYRKNWNDIFGKKYRISYDTSFKHFIFSFNIKSTLLFNELKQNYRFFGRLPFLRINLLTTAKTKNEFKFLIKSYKFYEKNWCIYI